MLDIRRGRECDAAAVMLLLLPPLLLRLLLMLMLLILTLLLLELMRGMMWIIRAASEFIMNRSSRVHESQGTRYWELGILEF